MNIHTKLRFGFLSALLLLLTTGLIAQYWQRQSREEAAWVSHTHEVLAELQRVWFAAHTAERDERGYLLTGDQQLADRFHDSGKRVTAHLARLKDMTRDDPRQQQRLDRLKSLLDQSLAVEEAYVVAAQADRQKAALRYALTFANDEETIQKIERCRREMTEAEELLLPQRSRLSHNSSSASSAFVATGTFLGTIFVALCGFWMSRALHRCERAECTLREVQEKLEARVEERTADLSRIAASLEAELSQHQKTEEQLRQSEQRYRLLFEDSPLPMEVFDPETLAFLAVNTAAAELYGYSAEEFLHMTVKDIRPPEEVPVILSFLETVKDSETYSGTFVTRHKSGRLITIEARVRTIQFGGRRARLKLVTDITEHKRLETQLRQAQKMEAIGRLAGGVAHDFNNLLTVILGYSDSILHKIDDADPIRAKVSEIHAAGQRAANLTSQLLAFSRKQILQVQTLNVNSVVSNISQMLRRLLGEDIQISLHLDDDLGHIQADPAQLEQVLVNLAVNARDAMPQGGQLVIETRNIELDQQSATLQGVPPGQYVLLVVNDTGFGMDEATKAQIFEPFFTTKDVGKGTGLGLSMVLGVVQQSGGTVTVYSEVGLGTTFRIYLPRIDAVPVEAEPPAESHFVSAPNAKGTTILLVEDENQLRTLAREVLREAGYTVLEASNGKEALAIAETLTSPPALLLTDVVMPEMSGLELAQELQKKWPVLAVLYTSGYTDHALLGRSGLRRDMPFLQKPYMPGSLLEQVTEVLDRECCSIVLIVDDDKQVREQLHGSLEEAGYRVLEAADGRQAMAQISAHPVKLVISDLFMPEKDGMELIRELRKSRPEVKILALSGAMGGSYLKLASTLGADVVLPKPFLQEQITQMAEALLV